MLSDRDWVRVRKLEKELVKAFGNELGQENKILAFAMTIW